MCLHPRAERTGERERASHVELLSSHILYVHVESGEALRGRLLSSQAWCVQILGVRHSPDTQAQPGFACNGPSQLSSPRVLGPLRSSSRPHSAHITTGRAHRTARFAQPPLKEVASPRNSQQKRRLMTPALAVLQDRDGHVPSQLPSKGTFTSASSKGKVEVPIQVKWLVSGACAQAAQNLPNGCAHCPLCSFDVSNPFAVLISCHLPRTLASSSLSPSHIVMSISTL